jgi:hypothetical protein
MKPIRLRAPLGAFGAVVGLAAASVFMPDGCRIDAAASLRLRVGIPLLTPMIFVALGWWLTRKWRARTAVALAFTATSLWSAGIGLLYETPKGILLSHIAALTVLPMIVAALLLAPLALRWSRRASESRALPASSDRATVWSFTAAAGALSVGVFHLLSQAPLDLRLAWGGFAGAVMLCAVALVAFDDIRRNLHKLSSLAGAPATASTVPLEAPLPDAAQIIDYGVGDARRDAIDPQGAGPFRAGVSAVYLGDRDESLRRARQDRTIAAVALVLALLGTLAAGVAIAHAPPWKAPSSEPISIPGLGGC